MIKTLMVIMIITIGLFFAFIYGKKAEVKVLNNNSPNSEKTTKEISEQEDLKKPDRSIDFEELSKKAYIYLNEQQTITEEKYGIGNTKSGIMIKKQAF